MSELEAGWATAGHSHQDSKLDPCPPCPQFAIFLSLIMLVEVAAAIAGYVFRDKVSRGKGEGPTSEVWLLWDVCALKFDLNNAPSSSQVMLEFNKDFRQQMQNYRKDNRTTLALDKMQEDVSEVAGSRDSGGRRFLPSH